jgi:hypothetical protein
MKLFMIAGILALPLLAQPITDPPVMLHLIRKAGRDIVSFPSYAGTGAAVNVFGMTSITGPAETWLMETHNSFASVEEVNERVRPGGLDRLDDRLDHLSGDVLSDSRSVIAVYRPGLSYRPDQAARMLSRTRYFSVMLYHVRPGAETAFSEALKTRKDVFDTINLDRPDIAYQVVSGAPAGTYLLFAPLTSLKTLDEGLGRRSSSIEPRASNKTLSDAEINRGQLLFRIQPQISYVSDEFASESPEFWRPRQAAQ